MLPIGHNDGVLRAQFSPDGKKIVTASLDHTAKIWDAGTGNLLADLNKHTDVVLYAGFSPDGKKVVTTSQDATTKVWEVATGELVTELRLSSGMAFSARFSPDGKSILTRSKTADIFDAATGKILFSCPTIMPRIVFGLPNSIESRINEYTTCQFSPDGKKILTITPDSTAKIWDASNGNFLMGLKNIQVKVISAQFSNDGKKYLLLQWIVLLKYGMQ